MYDIRQKVKRHREDGQISKQEYKIQENQLSKTPRAPFQRASDSVLANRRMVKTFPKSKDRYSEYMKMVSALNSSFREWVLNQLKDKGAEVDLSEGIADYISHVRQLDERYLKKHGEVLTFGSGDCGQLAHGVEEDDLEVKFPRIVYSLRSKKICSIACGGLHNAVCTSDGKVWTWGCSDDGGLGRGGEENLPGAVVDLIEDEVVTQVACGDSHTIVLTLAGTVYGWGSYKDKEGKAWFDGNGADDIKKSQKVPFHIKGLQDICDIKCGVSYNLALDMMGRVFSWGIGECGELSRSVCKMRFENGEYDFQNILKTHLTPAQMIIDSDGSEVVQAIGCGGYHSLIVTGPDFKVFTSGLNNYGQLGHGDEQNRQMLEHVAELDGCEITHLTGGMHHSLVLSQPTGKLYAFGRGDSGQLGVQIKPPVGYCEKFPIELNIDEPMHSIACGANHNLALSKKGSLYSWGYGDMNQLGHGKDGDEYTPKKLNFKMTDFSKIEVLQIAGGGQHSAIIGDVTSAN